MDSALGNGIGDQVMRELDLFFIFDREREKESNRERSERQIGKERGERD